MPSKYWVGGTSTWDATAGTKWATTDGGAGGTAVPGIGDDVFFTAASGTCTVTISNLYTPNVNNVTASAGCNVTLNFTSGTLGVSGSIDIAGLTNPTSGSGTINLAGTLTTLTCNLGKPFNNPNSVDVNMTGTGTYTFSQDQSFAALTLGGSQLKQTAGTISCTVFTSNSTNSSLNQTGGTISCRTGSGTPWTWSNGNIVSCVDLQFACNSTSTVQFLGGSKTYGNITVTYGVANGVFAVFHTNTYNNFIINRNGQTGCIFYLSGNANGTNTILGNFTLNGFSTTNRLNMALATPGTLIKNGGNVTVQYAILQNIVGSGTASFYAADSVDNGGNTNWQFITSGGDTLFFGTPF